MPPPPSLSLFTLNVDTHTFLLSSHFTFSYHMCERSPPHIFFAQLSLFALFLYFPPNPNSATITVCLVLWSRRRQEPFIWLWLQLLVGSGSYFCTRKKLLKKQFFLFDNIIHMFIHVYLSIVLHGLNSASVPAKTQLGLLYCFGWRSVSSF